MMKQQGIDKGIRCTLENSCPMGLLKVSLSIMIQFRVVFKKDLNYEDASVDYGTVTYRGKVVCQYISYGKGGSDQKFLDMWISMDNELEKYDKKITHVFIFLQQELTAMVLSTIP